MNEYEYELRKRLFQIEQRTILTANIAVFLLSAVIAYGFGWSVFQIFHSEQGAVLTGILVFFAAAWAISESSKAEYPPIYSFPGYTGPVDELTESDLAALGEISTGAAGTS